MARPYEKEMSNLSDTFAWAAAADIKPLRQAVRKAGLWPMRAIGSGGSLTGAHAIADLHRRYTGQLAAAGTPLDAVHEPLDTATTTWLVSAGGNNVDIVAAAKALILREPRQCGVICANETSRLAKLCRQHPFVDLLLYSPPAGKDGFLATNSLLGFAVLLTRAYATEYGPGPAWEETVACLEPLLSDESDASTSWKMATAPLWTRPTTLVLHGPSTRIGAIDLESKFTEAAIGHVQIADYRNFAHGRHHWLAKRGDSSSVLAFVTDTDRAIAERTLDLIPKNVMQAQIMFDGAPVATAIASLLATLRITGWAGRTRGIDPGRPGVPDFGRKLYRLSLPSRTAAPRLPKLTPRDRAAIDRKAAAAVGQATAHGELDRWRKALADFRDRLHGAHFGGIVLDYDGTVVDTRYRSDPVDPPMATALVRLAQAGTPIAFATGRGASIRRDLQRRIPRDFWLVAVRGG